MHGDGFDSTGGLRGGVLESRACGNQIQRVLSHKAVHPLVLVETVVRVEARLPRVGVPVLGDGGIGTVVSDGEVIDEDDVSAV